MNLSYRESKDLPLNHKTVKEYLISLEPINTSMFGGISQGREFPSLPVLCEARKNTVVNFTNNNRLDIVGIIFNPPHNQFYFHEVF